MSHSYRKELDDQISFSRETGVLTVDGNSWTMPVSGTTIPSSAGAAADLAAGLALKVDLHPGIRSVVNGTGALTLADDGGFVVCSNASGCVMTIPANATVAFSLGASVELVGTANSLTLAAAIGVTLDAPVGFTLVAPTDSVVKVRKYGEDTWGIMGQMTPN